MSNNTSGESGSFYTENGAGEGAAKQPSTTTELLGQFHSPNSLTSTTTNSNGSNEPPPAKKKRNLPGNPDPSAEVVALSPKTLMATNRFICEICKKGFQRDQNLQLHRRGHNLPWKLKQRSSTEMIRKRVYVCPEPSCVHHNPARALGDLTGIKKHFCRKHGEKKWKCDKCSKKYAVQSDWKAHSKICGTREYKCDCGTIFSRRDSFITHRAFCDALAEENNKGNIERIMSSHPRLVQQGQQIPNHLVTSLPNLLNNNNTPQIGTMDHSNIKHPLSLSLLQELMPMPNNTNSNSPTLFPRTLSSPAPPSLQLNVFEQPPLMSATALLQKAAQMGATMSNNNNEVVTSMAPASFGSVGHNNNNNSSHHLMQEGQYLNGMNGVDMFNAILDQSKAFSNNNNKGSGDVMTLDFLGINGGGHIGNFYATLPNHQAAEKATRDHEIWRNWSNNNDAGFESFSATSSIN